MKKSVFTFSVLTLGIIVGHYTPNAYSLNAENSCNISRNGAEVGVWIDSSDTLYVKFHSAHTVTRARSFLGGEAAQVNYEPL